MRLIRQKLRLTAAESASWHRPGAPEGSNINRTLGLKGSRMVPVLVVSCRPKAEKKTEAQTHLH